MFYSKSGEQMAYPDALIWLQSNRDITSLQSQWFLLDGYFPELQH